MPQITHYKLIIKSTKLKPTNAELIRKILGGMKKEGNSDFIIYSLLNSPLIPSFYNRLTFTYFPFAVHHKPDIFSPALFSF